MAADGDWAMSNLDLYIEISGFLQQIHTCSSTTCFTDVAAVAAVSATVSATVFVAFSAIP